ncbi:MAG: hypothetical protein QOF09_4601 [Alphaproteobacteria bacterium]|nr:hypothetical protein [Alphaproteobacteria bacterium]
MRALSSKLLFRFSRLGFPYQIRAVRRFGDKRPEREKFRVSSDAPQSGRFHAEPVVIGLQCAIASPQRMLLAEELAEGKELGSNGL